MKKALPVIFAATLWFAGFLSISQAQSGFSVGDVGEEDKMGAVNKQDDLNDIDRIEQNVNDMLKLLEDLENGGSLGEKLKVTKDKKSKLGEADPLDQFIKPDEPSGSTKSSQKKIKKKETLRRPMKSSSLFLTIPTVIFGRAWIFGDPKTRMKRSCILKKCSGWPLKTPTPIGTWVFCMKKNRMTHRPLTT